MPCRRRCCCSYWVPCWCWVPRWYDASAEDRLRSSCWWRRRSVARWVQRWTDTALALSLVQALVAKGSFKQGDVILLEEAILSLAAGASPVAALGLLSRSQRRRLAALHCHTRLAPARAEDGAGALSEQLGEEGERLLEEMVASGVWTAEQAVQDAGWLWQLLRVWDANKLSFVTAQGPEQCVFERISRLNHSCEPNVRLLPAGPKQLLVVAAVDIREGEELCICYPERNILPMLHFLHAPTSWRRRTLERWQFLCRCVRCEAPRPEQVEDLEEEARALVSPLQAATSSEDFPIDQVLQLLSQCQDAGLGCDHWLSFWLLSLCMVGSSARPLQVASHGVARASHLPVLPGSLQPLAERCPNAAQLLAQGDRGAGTAPRPGVTARLTSYFSFSGVKKQRKVDGVGVRAGCDSKGRSSEGPWA
ncbi:unnamed protein product [Durusdinium trenchii]|uniref:SET domain-containing protein n=2 Tax=Durusdinium trenchii TaxID=1381693 RepID=A0ABP0PW53_9DINO